METVPRASQVTRQNITISSTSQPLWATLTSQSAFLTFSCIKALMQQQRNSSFTLACQCVQSSPKSPILLFFWLIKTVFKRCVIQLYFGQHELILNLLCSLDIVTLCIIIFDLIALFPTFVQVIRNSEFIIKLLSFALI